MFGLIFVLAVVKLLERREAVAFGLLMHQLEVELLVLVKLRPHLGLFFLDVGLYFMAVGGGPLVTVLDLPLLVQHLRLGARRAASEAVLDLIKQLVQTIEDQRDGECE